MFVFSFPKLGFCRDKGIAFIEKAQLNESICDKIVRILELLTMVTNVMIVLLGEHLSK